MERHIPAFSLTAFFVVAVAAFSFSAGPVFAQPSPSDTTIQKASSTTGITVTIVQDTASRKADSLSAAGDTTGLSPDSLAATHDTLGAANDTVAVKKDTLQILTSNATYNTIPGFRVQILTTQDLNEAISAKSRADSLLPGYNIYIVYDSPYYKVRVGDFRARYEANQAVPFIAGHGFPSAWLVPDNVFRNPARRPN